MCKQTRYSVFDKRRASSKRTLLTSSMYKLR